MTLADVVRMLPEVKLMNVDVETLQKTIFKIGSDSRQIEQGELFIALKGENFDGNQFLPEVFAKGALAALASSDEVVAREMPVLLVPDTLEAIQLLAQSWRTELATRLAVVTGSNGKTTVKEMIASIFEQAVGTDCALSTKGNFNNEIGLPLTLLRLNGNHRLAVIELGMNHVGETAVLADLARPDIALINNAQREHQEFLKGVQAVAEEHAHVLDALGSSGIAVFPADSEYSALWRDRAGNRPVIDFQLLKTNELIPGGPVVQGFWASQSVLNIAITPKDSTKSMLQVQVQLNILGEHNARNALAATAVALGAGIDIQAIRSGLEKFTPVAGRMQVKGLPNFGELGIVIDDTYNANPDSVRAAVDVLAELDGKRWLVLGDMGEVGDQGPKFHQEVGEYAKNRGIDCLFATGTLTWESVSSFNSTIGPLQANHGDGAWHFEDAESLSLELKSRLQVMKREFQNPAVSILVKGSRFTKMERVVNTLLREESTCC